VVTLGAIGAVQITAISWSLPIRALGVGASTSASVSRRVCALTRPEPAPVASSAARLQPECIPPQPSWTSLKSGRSPEKHHDRRRPAQTAALDADTLTGVCVLRRRRDGRDVNTALIVMPSPTRPSTRRTL
jgi:hypothetical protein